MSHSIVIVRLVRYGQIGSLILCLIHNVAGTLTRRNLGARCSHLTDLDLRLSFEKKHKAACCHTVPGRLPASANAAERNNIWLRTEPLPCQGCAWTGHRADPLDFSRKRPTSPESSQCKKVSPQHVSSERTMPRAALATTLGKPSLRLLGDSCAKNQRFKIL